MPDALPDFVIHRSYVSFSELFPRSRGLVSHGGVGTTAQALAAGIPHLVTHVNFDQRDKASRLEDLSAGFGIPMKDFEARSAVEAVGKVLTASYAGSARDLSRKTTPELSRIAAAKAIERTAGF